MNNNAEQARNIRSLHEEEKNSTPRLDPKNPDREGTFGLEGETYIEQLLDWPSTNRNLRVHGDRGVDYIVTLKNGKILRYNIVSSDIRPWETRRDWKTLNLQVKEHNVLRADRFIAVVRRESGFEVAGFATQDDLLKADTMPSKARDKNGVPYQNRIIRYDKLRKFDGDALREATATVQPAP